MHPLIADKQDELEALCRRHRVKALYLFGSATREDFDPQRSDLDLLVEFEAIHRPTFSDLMTMEDELRAVFGRDIDLVDRVSVEESKNYIRRESILGNLEPLYAA